MEYGAAYLRPQRSSDDDAASMLSEQRNSLYQPYRPEHRRQSSDAWPARASWNVSPIALQQSLPPIPLGDGLYNSMRPSIFGSRAVLDSPYQEPVAWENSTQFRSVRRESPKPEVQRTVVALPESDYAVEARRYFRHPRHIPEAWRSGFWLRFPWCGFGALTLILLLTGVSAGILLASNDTSPEHWKVGDDNAQPSVYIAVFEMVMNFLILFALADGLVIKLWRQLLCGCTLSAVHDVYESSSLWPALKRICRLQFNVVAVACILAVTSALRGPLFQRALTVQDNMTSGTSGSMDLGIAPFPIVEYFRKTGSDPRQGGATTSFSTLIKDTNAGSGLAFAQPSGCGADCTGKVNGFAFKADCSPSTRPFDLKNIPAECKSCKTAQCASACSNHLATDLNPTLFSIGFRTDTSNIDVQKHALILNTIHKNESSCEGNTQVQTCMLTQVTADYTIVIRNNTIDRLASEPNSNIYDTAMPLNAELMRNYWPLAFESLFPPVMVNVTPVQDFSKLQYRKCTKSSNSQLDDCSDGTNLQPALLADASILYATENTAPQGQDPLCSLAWRDPMQDMINKLNSLAFRITVDMANSDGSVFAPSFTDAALTALRTPWHQSIDLDGQRTSTLYRTNKILVVFGVLLSIIGVVAILPLYNGFWELGRKFSLNPLEIARAFGAPLLEGVDGNATPEMVTFERGGMNVRYGALERFRQEKKLRIEETNRATVRVPWQGEIFG